MPTRCRPDAGARRASPVSATDLFVLYICIPTYNEAPTVGVLLWRIRSLFQEYSRDYEVVVYDDGSADATAEVLEPYAKVLPLTLLGGKTHRGYAAALDALCRHVAQHTRYPRRDAAIFMQADFTDRPEHIPELVKRFEGGADIVVAEPPADAPIPTPLRRLRSASSWILRPFVRVAGVADLTGTLRLFRVAVLRDLVRQEGDTPVVRENGWPANVELLLATVPLARRVETVPLDQRFDVRLRATRLRPAADAMAMARFAWRARGRSASPGSALRPASNAGGLASAPAPPTPPVASAPPTPYVGPPRRSTLAALSPSADDTQPVDLAPFAAADDETPASDTLVPPRRSRRSGRRKRKPASPPVDATVAEPAFDPDVPQSADNEPADRPRKKRRPSRRKRATTAPPDAGPNDASPLTADAADPAAAEPGAPEARRRVRRRKPRRPRSAQQDDTNSTPADPAPPPP